MASKSTVFDFKILLRSGDPPKRIGHNCPKKIAMIIFCLTVA